MQPIKSITPKELTTGIMGYYVHGDSTTFGYIDLKKGSMVPMHHHVHEQITYIVSGQLDMNIGGVQYSLTPGMVHVIPSNTPHNAVAVVDTVAIDTFSPVREDYKPAL
jgi:quercetin dioxygenase-like cupin family protein